MTLADVFSIDIAVRNYELDTQGHVNSAIYLMYAEHARWQHLEGLGIGPRVLAAHGVGPVFLELTIKYLRELRAGDIVTVTSEFVYPDTASKTFFVDQRLITHDDTLVATLRSTTGLLDLRTRKLVADPRHALAALADPSSQEQLT